MFQVGPSLSGLSVVEAMVSMTVVIAIVTILSTISSQSSAEIKCHNCVNLMLKKNSQCDPTEGSDDTCKGTKCYKFDGTKAGFNSGQPSAMFQHDTSTSIDCLLKPIDSLSPRSNY